MYFEQLILFVISLVANLFSAFAGGGAGLIQFPVLIFLGLPFSIALATHKIASVALGVGATLRNLKTHHLHRKQVLTIVGFGVPGVIVGANIILAVPDREAEISLGILTIGLGLYSLFNPDLGMNKRDIKDTFWHRAGGGMVIFVIGALNGSLTSGTGLFVTLWLVRHYGMDYKLAVAYTLVLVGLFWNGTGAITLTLLTTVQWSWLPALLLGSLLGGYIGAHLAIVKGNRWIKRSYETITLILGLKLIFGNL
ncbi:MAG: sulfite exporter TauE/SafE family protein [Gammaproteobacteria bacterium]|nr:sulfite exporter TauE/SafE family protein [Gammaproteobacteria bacterium]MDH5802132.1 sulfite exporter TauE/SafE family protein [Gammaproteobacteria bacterium]